MLAAGHAELAGKLTRAPRPGERTYTATLGVTGTAALAIAAAALSAGLLIVWSRAPAGWALVPLIPLVPPAIAAWTLSRGRARRPPAATALYLPLCFASYIVLGLAR